MKIRLIHCFITAVILCLPLLTIAQAPIPPAVNDVPIDGGLSLLLVAGVGYGIKKYREQKRK